MKRFLILAFATALLAAACASGDATEGEALPTNPGDVEDGSASDQIDEPMDETPIPVEPDGGIGDGAGPLPVIDPGLAEYVEGAVQQLSDSLGDASLIQVVAAHEVTWPDGSLGCPEPDMAYTQALVDGYRIELSDGERTFTFHGAIGDEPFECVPTDTAP